MMMEDAIHKELQALPSSSPPQRPSWSALRSAGEANSPVNPLWNISEAVDLDESAHIEELIPLKTARSLNLRRVDGRFCFGLSLGVLVPAILAILIVLRSIDIGDAAKPPSNAVKQKQFGVLLDSESQTHLNVSSPGVQRKDLTGQGKDFSQGPSHPLTDRARISFAEWENANDLTGDSSRNHVLEDSTNTEAPLSTSHASKIADSSTTKSEVESHDQDAGFPVAKKTEFVMSDMPSSQSNGKTPPLNSANKDGRPGLRGASTPHSYTPWYFYLVYAFSVATGVAWVVLVVNECRERAS